jgi:hypothetical protein
MTAFLEAACDIVPVPNSRIVLHYSDFHSRIIMVARREGTGEYQVTTLLDWNNTMAVPPERALSFWWVEQTGYSESENSERAGEKLKYIVKSIKNARKLGWFAAYGLHVR